MDCFASLAMAESTIFHVIARSASDETIDPLLIARSQAHPPT
jgi:hypothetical protein